MLGDQRLAQEAAALIERSGRERLGRPGVLEVVGELLQPRRPPLKRNAEQNRPHDCERGARRPVGCRREDERVGRVAQDVALVARQCAKSARRAKRTDRSAVGSGSNARHDRLECGRRACLTSSTWVSASRHRRPLDVRTAPRSDSHQASIPLDPGAVVTLIHPRPPFLELAFLPSERRVRGTLDGIWYYPDPLREVAGVEGCVAPYSERVDPIGDGELPQRPGSPLAAPTPSRQETK